MRKASLLAGIFALTLFSYAQYQGWNCFVSEASGTYRAARSWWGGRYHK
jgi:hypothetical protein